MRTLDIDECAEFLKVNRTTALELAGNGTLPGAKIGRSWVFLEDDLTDYLRTEAQRQRRARLAGSVISEQLQASAARTPVSAIVVEPRGRGRQRRTLPTLTDAPSP